MSDTDTDTVRQAAAAALGHPFAEEAFRLVAEIEERVTDDEIAEGAEHHEVAAEIVEWILETKSTREQAALWAVLQADDAGADLYADGAATSARIHADLFTVIERAVFAAIQKHAGA